MILLRTLHVTLCLLLSFPFENVNGFVASRKSSATAFHPTSKTDSDRSGRPGQPLLRNSVALHSSHTAIIGDDFESFLEWQQKRKIIKGSGVFEGVSSMDLERLAQLAKRIDFEDANELVFRQGDRQSGDMYFVASGSFECVPDDSPDNVVKVYEGKGKYFGEAGALFGVAQGLSARTGQADSAVWKLEKSSIDVVLPRQSNERKAAQDATMVTDAKIAECIQRQSAPKMIRKFPPFANIAKDDLDRLVASLELVEINKGQVVTNQGEEGDFMLFAIDGELSCFLEDTGEVLATCGARDYVGELSLFFRAPRALSVKATKATKAWKLQRQDFLNSVQETSVASEALQLLQERYEEETLLGTLLKMRWSDVNDFLVLSSRPKKKPVSLHSALSIIAMGIFLGGCLPLFAPGFDEHGLPRVFDVNGRSSDITLIQMNAATIGMAVTGVMGTFRLPPNSPDCRRFLFNAAAAFGVATAACAASNLTCSEFALFNAFSWHGKMFLTLSAAVLQHCVLRCIDDAIAGSNKGRDTIPAIANRFQALLVCMLVGVVTCFLTAPAVVPTWWSSKDMHMPIFSEHAQNGFIGSLTTTSVRAQASLALASLVATLRFEKKVTEFQAQMLLVLCVVPTAFDSVVFGVNAVLSSSTQPGAAEANACFSSLLQESGFVTMHFLLLFGTIANGMHRRLSQASDDGASEEGTGDSFLVDSPQQQLKELIPKIKSCLIQPAVSCVMPRSIVPEKPEMVETHSDWCILPSALLLFHRLWSNIIRLSMCEIISH